MDRTAVGIGAGLTAVVAIGLVFVVDGLDALLVAGVIGGIAAGVASDSYAREFVDSGVAAFLGALVPIGLWAVGTMVLHAETMPIEAGFVHGWIAVGAIFVVAPVVGLTGAVTGFLSARLRRSYRGEL